MGKPDVKLKRSPSTVSAKSEDTTHSGQISSNEGSLSSLITSPTTNRKVRPPDLRNFELSKFTGQMQEQKAKYLPPPRMGKSSDESTTKPTKPLRKKARRKSEEESQKLEKENNKINKDINKKITTFEFKFVGSKT